MVGKGITNLCNVIITAIVLMVSFHLIPNSGLFLMKIVNRHN